ncbi:MAG: hypothetical protein RBT43_02465, partial [bacterium]|nr:hypothetical protein [bacterium]
CLFAQDINNERLFLDIDTDITDALPGRNPAFLHRENIPFNYAFSYRLRHDGGEDRLPYTPALKRYQNLGVTAYTEMENGMFFAGRFSYRYEQRRDKLFLHNAENYLDMPFYFGDSTSGGFDLNGIDWNVIFSYPLSARWRAGVDVFYNVDEQFKTVFPKPNIKRNDVHLRPALAYQGESLQFGVTASFFRYRELMNTRKYVLEQGRSPVFMRIRGLDRPVLTYAQTSEERLQSIGGNGISANLDLGGILLLETFYERSHAEIVDGASYPEAQGNWDLDRFSWRLALRKTTRRSGISELFFEQHIRKGNGFHPTLDQRIYALYYRAMEGGISLPYSSSPGESLNATISYLIEDYKREDNFFGLLQYVPAHMLRMEINYKISGMKADFEMDLQYAEDICIGEPVVYSDLSGDYYAGISAAELAYYLKDRRELGVEMRIGFPFYGRRLLIDGSYTNIIPQDSDARFHYAETGLTFVF